MRKFITIDRHSFDKQSRIFLNLPQKSMSKLICLCKGVREDAIISATDEENASSLVDIQELTGAGSNCGRCTPKIELILAAQSKAKLV